MKRQRVSTTGAYRTKRPIDKSLVAISKTVNTTQSETTLVTATFPCTITGLRWEVSAVNTYATASNSLYWAIVLMKDGEAAQTIATSDGSSLYQPEQNVLVWGVDFLAEDSATVGQPRRGRFEGSSKTMRKLMAGDQLKLIMLAGAASVGLRGCVQFFCKT